MTMQNLKAKHEDQQKPKIPKVHEAMTEHQFLITLSISLSDDI